MKLKIGIWPIPSQTYTDYWEAHLDIVDEDGTEHSNAIFVFGRNSGECLERATHICKGHEQ